MKINKMVAVNAQCLPAFAALVADSSWTGVVTRGFVAAGHAGATTSVKTRPAVAGVLTQATTKRGTAQVLIPDPNPPV